MLYIGIDVAKSKHDCFIIDSDGVIIHDVFQIKNNRQGFDILVRNITDSFQKSIHQDIRIGLESTGHYSTNLEAFLSQKNFNLTVFNPLSVNLFRKSRSLRKTKTDKTDARCIALMLHSIDSESYTPVSYNIMELKSLSRHRFRLIGYRSKLKVSVTRLIDILFPELPDSVWSIHQNSSYEMLLEFPTAIDIANAHITKFTNILNQHSKGHYGKEKALELRSLAAQSIGLPSSAQGFELQQTITLIQQLQLQIDQLDARIKKIVDDMDSPIMTIPGISYTLAATILSEIGDIHNFSSPAKLLAFAGLEPSVFQSGQFNSSNTPMVKRGSTYLRYAILMAARLISRFDPTFKSYLDKKRAEGKHYNVAIGHVGKKLIRVIFHLLKNNLKFVTQ